MTTSESHQTGKTPLATGIETTALLNGDFVGLEAARISPMDRGFLFGDGIYEVIPSYNRKLVGFERHLERLNDGLNAIGIANPHSDTDWHTLLTQLLSRNEFTSAGIYLQVTRGVSSQRAHRFPEGVTPTVFAYPFPINAPNDGNPATAKAFSVVTGIDQRWKRCHIKSVALLGNVLHMMEGVDAGAEEILLFNDRDQLTEAAACNVFIVKDKVVATPALDQEKLPGITRNMLVDMMRDSADWVVEERAISRAEVLAADEVWLTSSTKEIAPVSTIDGKPVGAKCPGDVWMQAQALFATNRFKY